MTLKELKQIDGTYLDPEGNIYAHAEDFLCHMLGFCGCGLPEDALRYVQQGLRFITLKNLLPLKESQEKEKLIFSHSGGAHFFYYWADAQGITNHGSSVGGSWLTHKGRNILSLLEEWQADEETPS